jgi:hypothetical protein
VNEFETNAEENKTLKNNKIKPSINKIFIKYLKMKLKKKYNKKKLKVNNNKKK